MRIAVLVLLLAQVALRAAAQAGTCHDAVKGSDVTKENREEKEHCALDTTKHEVRCCSNTSITGYEKKSCNNGRVLYVDSDFSTIGCQHNKTWSQADDICNKMGARLCTRKELVDQCAKGTGCQHNHDLCWASTTELPGECTAQISTVASRALCVLTIDN